MARFIKSDKAGLPLGGPAREYTRKEKAVNWWDYHKWWVYLGITGVVIAAMMIHDLFFRPQPDYRISYVAEQGLSDETVYALEDALQALGGDRNGDGRVLVQVDTYVLTFAEQATPLEEYYMSNAITQLLASIASSDGSYIYILDDPAGFQAETGALQYLDGVLPPEEAVDWENMVRRWADCPSLDGLELEEPLAGLYVGRRAAFDAQQRENAAAYDALWQAMTAGAE